MIVMVAVTVIFGSYPSLSWLLVIPALLLQFVFNTGLALVTARLGSKTPDLAQLMPFVMRTWMYASGVMFSIPVMLKDKPARSLTCSSTTRRRSTWTWSASP